MNSDTIGTLRKTSADLSTTPAATATRTTSRLPATATTTVEWTSKKWRDTPGDDDDDDDDGDVDDYDAYEEVDDVFFDAM